MVNMWHTTLKVFAQMFFCLKSLTTIDAISDGWMSEMAEYSEKVNMKLCILEEILGAKFHQKALIESNVASYRCGENRQNTSQKTDFRFLPAGPHECPGEKSKVYKTKLDLAVSINPAKSNCFSL